MQSASLKQEAPGLDPGVRSPAPPDVGLAGDSWRGSLVVVGRHVWRQQPRRDEAPDDSHHPVVGPPTDDAALAVARTPPPFRPIKPSRR